ncbi:21 kDa subunit of NADH dehydrogenase [Daldinia caldariorum]|uniref:21 kDa subunit of NADH dehydrogenase n=1 Tax=Daldinia caldariorum TaxID=326644 RepID=UPI002008E892|nr:21 kDa subunit of NADH dehydrogenase [Daldinia caldariorum]KAI1466088.1 21 kDa subunit of NADH dehydrogenase [Daldinia caldariorum]
MASKAVAKAASSAAGGVVSITQKQTLQSVGIWERIRRALAVDPNRSNGIPLNPYYRNPPPGALDPATYDDPVTIPAGDIADNAYWRRDARRAYPKLSFVTQADAVALLAVGSAAAPRQELVGEAGEKQLVAAREEGSAGGLAAYFEKSKAAAVAAAKETLFVNGLPPVPSGERRESDGTWKVHDYALTESSYPEKYPCRSFK